MTLSTLVTTLLRVIHIFAAVTWVGGGVFLASVVVATVQAAGANGGRFMLRLASAGRMIRVLGGSAIATVLAGALWHVPTSGFFNSKWLSSRHGIFLTLGAVVGILAMLDGAFRTGPIGAKMAAVANDILARQGPPPPDLMKQAQKLGAKLASGAMLPVGLGSLALLYMAAAQTL
jgi:uncharacterized membrane protein